MKIVNVNNVSALTKSKLGKFQYLVNTPVLGMIKVYFEIRKMRSSVLGTGMHVE